MSEDVEWTYISEHGTTLIHAWVDQFLHSNFDFLKATSLTKIGIVVDPMRLAQLGTPPLRYIQLQYLFVQYR